LIKSELLDLAGAATAAAGATSSTLASAFGASATGASAAGVGSAFASANSYFGASVFLLSSTFDLSSVTVKSNAEASNSSFLLDLSDF
jgi:hypothetical protein